MNVEREVVPVLVVAEKADRTVVAWTRRFTRESPVPAPVDHHLRDVRAAILARRCA